MFNCYMKDSVLLPIPKHKIKYMKHQRLSVNNS